MAAFHWGPTPLIYFGAGRLDEIGVLTRRFGKRALAAVGRASLERGGHLERIKGLCAREGIDLHLVTVAGEPSPELIDKTVAQYRHDPVDVVVAIGGGSVIDAGKAISAMLRADGSVVEYLEGVGSRTHPGGKVPFIAVPTTAGTGSEATRNAVISHCGGDDGYKKSLRHDRFVPDIALIDPDLALGAPFELTVACGMDALSQLIEAYLSTKANPMSDALALSGLQTMIAALPSYASGQDTPQLRGAMAYAALMSGLALVSAGLGVVHGLAGPLGGYFPVPHGVACGTLLASAMAATLTALRRDRQKHKEALAKLAAIGSMMSEGRVGDDPCAAEDNFAMTLAKWTEEWGLPRLGAFGVRQQDVPLIVAAADCKNNPVALSREAMEGILLQRCGKC